MITLKRRVVPPLAEVRLIVPGDRKAWLARHDIEAQQTLAALVDKGRTREAVTFLEYHIARTAEIRFMVEAPSAEWAVALVRLNMRRTDVEVHEVRRLMRGEPKVCGRWLSHKPHGYFEGAARYDCDGAAPGGDAA